MQFSIVLSFIATASAATLLPRQQPTCPTTIAAPCVITTVLGFPFTFPACRCNPTCEGTLNIFGFPLRAQLGTCA
ncbi:hypothetical protein MY10362_009360 [Beauveria mimosiformis]